MLDVVLGGTHRSGGSAVSSADPVFRSVAYAMSGGNTGFLSTDMLKNIYDADGNPQTEETRTKGMSQEEKKLANGLSWTRSDNGQLIPSSYLPHTNYEMIMRFPIINDIRTNYPSEIVFSVEIKNVGVGSVEKAMSGTGARGYKPRDTLDRLFYNAFGGGRGSDGGQSADPYLDETTAKYIQQMTGGDWDGDLGNLEAPRFRASRGVMEQRQLRRMIGVSSFNLMCRTNYNNKELDTSSFLGSRYRYAGVVRTTDLTADPRMVLEPYIMMELTFGGTALITDIWGASQPGQHLWLVLRKYPLMSSTLSSMSTFLGIHRSELVNLVPQRIRQTHGSWKTILKRALDRASRLSADTLRSKYANQVRTGALMHSFGHSEDELLLDAIAYCMLPESHADPSGKSIANIPMRFAAIIELLLYHEIYGGSVNRKLIREMGIFNGFVIDDIPRVDSVSIHELATTRLVEPTGYDVRSSGDIRAREYKNGVRKYLTTMDGRVVNAIASETQARDPEKEKCKLHGSLFLAFMIHGTDLTFEKARSFMQDGSGHSTIKNVIDDICKIKQVNFKIASAHTTTTSNRARVAAASLSTDDGGYSSGEDSEVDGELTLFGSDDRNGDTQMAGTKTRVLDLVSDDEEGGREQEAKRPTSSSSPTQVEDDYGEEKDRTDGDSDDEQREDEAAPLVEYARMAQGVQMYWALSPYISNSRRIPSLNLYRSYTNNWTGKAIYVGMVNHIQANSKEVNMENICNYLYPQSTEQALLAYVKLNRVSVHMRR